MIAILVLLLIFEIGGCALVILSGIEQVRRESREDYSQLLRILAIIADIQRDEENNSHAKS